MFFFHVDRSFPFVMWCHLLAENVVLSDGLVVISELNTCRLLHAHNRPLNSIVLHGVVLAEPKTTKSHDSESFVV